MAKSKDSKTERPLHEAADVQPENIAPSTEPETDGSEASDVSTRDVDEVVDLEHDMHVKATDDAGEPSGILEGQGDGSEATVVDDQDIAVAEAKDATTPGASEPNLEVEPETATIEGPVPSRSGGFWPALAGGVIAAVLGFVAGRGDMLDAYFPRAEAPVAVDLAPLTQQLGGVSGRVGTLETTMSSGLREVSQSVADVQATIAELSARLDAVEARPTPPATVPADNSEDLAALQSTVADLKSRLADEDARASAEAERLLAQAALTRVLTAVENGESFVSALGDLERVASVQVPAALRDVAAEGVPTLSDLRDTFPEAARAGLAAARSAVPESEVSGVAGFLRRQLNVRSVAPREGTDPDAVLSRAEAALRSDDLGTALMEIEALPEAATGAMDDWLSGAHARISAQDAANALSDSLTVN